MYAVCPVLAHHLLHVHVWYVLYLHIPGQVHLWCALHLPIAWTGTCVMHPVLAHHLDRYICGMSCTCISPASGTCVVCPVPAHHLDRYIHGMSYTCTSPGQVRVCVASACPLGRTGGQWRKFMPLPSWQVEKVPI